MKRMTQILSLGLLLSISSIALAGQGHGRNGHDGYSGGQRHNSHQNERYDNRNHYRYANRYYVANSRYAPRHLHHGRYCYDWHPYGYAAPVVRYGYRSPGLVIVYQPNTGLYIDGGH